MPEAGADAKRLRAAPGAGFGGWPAGPVHDRGTGPRRTGPAIDPAPYRPPSQTSRRVSLAAPTAARTV